MTVLGYNDEIRAVEYTVSYIILSEINMEEVLKYSKL